MAPAALRAIPFVERAILGRSGAFPCEKMVFPFHVTVLPAGFSEFRFHSRAFATGVSAFPICVREVPIPARERLRRVRQFLEHVM